MVEIILSNLTFYQFKSILKFKTNAGQVDLFRMIKFDNFSDMLKL